ncbi:amidohydrolase family protein [Luteimonas marina]|uniref:Amidohydrolase family protein n=1 Tax=Luteimonas marina TaxID=488485 RepID=A0A5C5U9F7_9GAMM|nr:amidohydrolase family protein [Luteimonas marina]TWT22517.1 amidohydrolase family protein [Luteimonas marina]
MHSFAARGAQLRAILSTATIGLLLAACSPSTSDAATADPARSPEPVSQAVAFVGVNVVPMDRETVLEDHTVVVEDGKIVSVAPAGEAQVPEGAQRIDGAGRWLMPGLAEMHGHVPGPDDAAYAEDVLFLYVSNGVTTVRNMAGNASHLALRERIANGELPGPTLHAASPWLSDEKAGTPERAEQAVREYHAAGFDLLKIGGIPPDAYARMAQTAHALGMPFAGHVPGEVGLVGALDARQASIDHFDSYAEFLAAEGAGFAARDKGFFGSGVADLIDADRIPDAVARTLAAGTWNVPTLSLVEHLASPEPAESMIEWPEMRYMPKDVRDGWVAAKRGFQSRDTFQPAAAQRLVEVRQRLLKALHEADAPIALGSDAPQFFNVPGFSIHHEMRMMAAAGLTPYEVLATGTREPARYFGTPEAFGTVEPGRRADLVLLEANPLDDLANVQRRAGVMVGGRWWPEEEIQSRLQEIAEAVAGRDAG